MDSFKSFLFEMLTYKTVRSANVQNYYIGVTYRLTQTVLLVYIIGYDLILNKGYQEFDLVSSVVTTKVKGHGYVPISKTVEPYSIKTDLNFEYKVLDTTDYVIPPFDYNSLFIMTNFIRTEQNRHTCDKKSETSMRKIEWCPLENDSFNIEDNLIRNSLNHTIYIKNDIEFKKFKIKQRNIIPNITNEYISKCNYHENIDPYCPVFKVDYILKQAESDKNERLQMLLKGGVIEIIIEWNCDFDLGPLCLPKYSFRRFDTPFKETATSSGFNFRYAEKYIQEKREHRILFKAYGIRFIINVCGTAGKFSILPLMLTIGSGIGLMSVSVIFADCVTLHCSKRRHLYRQVLEKDIKHGELMKDIQIQPNTKEDKNDDSEEQRSFSGQIGIGYSLQYQSSISDSLLLI